MLGSILVSHQEIRAVATYNCAALLEVSREAEILKTLALAAVGPLQARLQVPGYTTFMEFVTYH